jgi:hypothetical protein
MGEQSFARMLAILRGRWRVMAAVGLPVVLLSVWFAASRPPAYTSEVVVGLHPEPAVYADNSFLRLMPRFLMTATGGSALRGAETRAGLPEGALDESVTAENPSGSTEILLTVTTASADAAPLAVGALADTVLRAAAEDPLVIADVLAGPSDAVDGTPTRQLLVLAVGLALAAALGVGLAFVIEGARPRVRVRDDVALLGIPALATVSGGHLSARWALPGHAARQRDELGKVRLLVEAAAVPPSSAGVAVVSPSPCDTHAVERLVTALSPPGEPHAGTGAARALPGLLVDQSTRDAVTDAGQWLLVLRAGTSLDDARDCVRLAELLNARVLGGVLVT